VTLYVQTASGIHLPNVASRCRIPTGRNELGEWVICGHPTFDREGPRAEAAHNAECTRRNHEHIVEYMRQRHPDVMKPWDTELAAWVGENADALIEGRKKLGGGAV
jgi:hypothetical protein